MATKPASVLDWASSTNYPADAEPEASTPTKVDLTDQATIGWRPGAKPPAQILNKWNNHAAAWLFYLKDGAFTGNHSIDGDLAVTGGFALTGGATVGGTLAVTGNISSSANVSAGGRLVAPQIELSGKPIIKHGSYRKTYSPLRSRFGGTGTGSPAVGANGIEYVALSDAGGWIQVYTDDLQPGHRILGLRVSWNINGASGGGSTPVCSMKLVGAATGNNIGLTLGTTADNGGNLFISDYAPGAGQTLSLEDVSAQGWAGTVADWAYRASFRIEAASNLTWITGVEVMYSAPVE